MSIRLAPRTAGLALAALLVTTPLSRANDLAELERNPHRVPETVKAKNDLEFSSGLVIKAGDVLRVQRIEGGELFLFQPDGNMLLTLDVAETTLLEDAAARYAAWTPEQQKLTLADFQSRKELWPYRVRIRREQAFQDGTKLAAGTDWPMMSYDGANVLVLDPVKYASFNLDPAATDFYDRVVAAVKTPPPSRLVQELSENVVRIGTGERVDLLAADAPPYLAIYHAAGWCGYCTQTTPQVLAWYEESKARGDRSIELLVISGDKTAADMQTHLKAKGFGGLTVPHGKDKPMFLLRETTVYNGLPNLIVVDRTGKLVIDSTNEMPMERTQRTLAQMRELQKKHAAQQARAAEEGAGSPSEPR
jgi:hypothetical protein